MDYILKLEYELFRSVLNGSYTEIKYIISLYLNLYYYLKILKLFKIKFLLLKC